jgi:dihydrolipoamide dehydrogenase
VLEGRLRQTMKDIFVNVKVMEMSDTGRGISVTFDGSRARELGTPVPPHEQQFDRVLIAVGRTPNSNGLGLENTAVKVSTRGFVEVNRTMCTADEHIYAIGDVAGEPMLAHKASYEAKIAVEVLAGEPASFDARAIPAVVFTDPELAWAGLTETQARQNGTEIQVVKFPWGASGRATAIGRNDGLTKFIVAPNTKRLLGVGIVGVNAGELISEGVLALEMGAMARDVGMSIHPHPTLSDTLGEGAELAFGTTTHLFRAAR